MAKRTVSFPIWDERLDGPNEERKIVAGDYRDKDYVIQLDGLTMVSLDTAYEESHSKSAPDWSLGTEARDANNHVLMTFGGEPPSPFKEALLEGRILYGVVIARDQQRHGR